MYRSPRLPSVLQPWSRHGRTAKYIFFENTKNPNKLNVLETLDECKMGARGVASYHSYSSFWRVTWKYRQTALQSVQGGGNYSDTAALVLTKSDNCDLNPDSRPTNLISYTTWLAGCADAVWDIWAIAQLYDYNSAPRALLIKTPVNTHTRNRRTSSQLQDRP